MMANFQADAALINAVEMCTGYLTRHSARKYWINFFSKDCEEGLEAELERLFDPNLQFTFTSLDIKVARRNVAGTFL